MAEFDLIGWDDTKKAIEGLTKDMRLKVVRGALRQAARPIVNAARSKVPVRTGLVKKRIGVSTSKIHSRKYGEVGVYIRPKATQLARKKKIRSQDPYYYKFIEAGFHAVGTRKIKGGRRNRAERLKASGARFIPGVKFLGNAFEEKKMEALEIFRTAVKSRIEKYNQRKR